MSHSVCSGHRIYYCTWSLLFPLSRHQLQRLISIQRPPITPKTHGFSSPPGCSQLNDVLISAVGRRPDVVRYFCFEYVAVTAAARLGPPSLKQPASGIISYPDIDDAFVCSSILVVFLLFLARSPPVEVVRGGWCLHSSLPHSSTWAPRNGVGAPVNCLAFVWL